MNMSIKTKITIVIFTILVLTVSAVAFVQYGKMQAAHQQKIQKLLDDLQDQKTLNDGLVRAASNQVSAGEIKNIVKAELNDIQSDLDTINARVISVSKTTGRLAASTQKPSQSDSVLISGGVPEFTKDIAWTSSDGTKSIDIAYAKVKPVGGTIKGLHERLTALMGPDQGDQATDIVLGYMSNPNVPPPVAFIGVTTPVMPASI